MDARAIRNRRAMKRLSKVLSNLKWWKSSDSVCPKVDINKKLDIDC